MKSGTAITEIKREVQLHEWSQQVKLQQESGMTVTAYCAANGINPKTYYYHLRKVREQCVGSATTIVPLNIQEQKNDIHIDKDNVHITLPANISSEFLITLVRELC